MASFGGTVLDLMTSEISRLSAISSLRHTVIRQKLSSCLPWVLSGCGAPCLQTTARRSCNLLVQGGARRGRPPTHHLEGPLMLDDGTGAI